MTLTKRHLVTRISEETSLGQQQVFDVVQKTLDYISEALAKNNKVELRTLQTERTIGEDWLVTGGLSAGDKVIIEGLQKVAPGAEVKVVALGADAYPVAGQ